MQPTTPRVLRYIGYWIRDLLDTEFVAPQELVGHWDDDVRSRVLDYLQHGEFTSSLGFSWCRFPDCPTRDNFSAMGSGDHTDGVWAWPEGLAHYVREHGVQLPTEFVEHVLAQGGPPTVLPELDHPLVMSNAIWFDDGEPRSLERDVSFWTRWCREHGSARIRSRIAELREQALSSIAASNPAVFGQVVDSQSHQVLQEWLDRVLREASPQDPPTSK